MVVVDPPFITHAVWESYAITVKLLLKSGTNADGSPKGKVILTTLQENADHLYSILRAKPTVSNSGNTYSIANQPVGKDITGGALQQTTAYGEAHAEVLHAQQRC